MNIIAISNSRIEWLKVPLPHIEGVEIRIIQNFQQTANSTALHPMEEDKAVKENMTANQTIMPVMKKQKSAETMHKTETHLWVKRNQGIGGYTAGSSLKKYNKSKKQRPKNHQIIGDLNTTDSSNEYSLENTLAMESFESIKGKPGLSLEGEEINHRMKTVEQSISSDYSLFDSQSSREDIRKQRSRLLRLDTSVARRAAAALEDSIVSAPTQDEQEKSAAEENRQRIPEVEGTQDNLVANS
uniref:Uncharacterized protein n=1 Tax=Setaria digitata TaxID=48799 RepID=A0A915PMZ9_9BILA